MSVFVKVAVMDHSYDVLQRDDIRGQEAKVPERVISFLRAHDALDGVPAEAFLEVLVNALAHRDVERGSAVMVKAFPDRIEVVSLGGLPDDLGIQDLLNGVNVERNKELAARLRRAGLYHGLGIGLSIVMGAYEGSGRIASLSAASNSLRVTLPRMKPVMGVRVAFPGS